jgi:isocitrate/isopropylmalate dehydrogenase
MNDPIEKNSGSAGDGIDPEVVEQVQKIIAWMNHELSAGFEKSHRATR